MFIDLDRLTAAELAAFAARLPGPHAWTHISEAVCGSKDVFLCRACFVHFTLGEPMPEGACAAVDLSAGAILLDGLPLDEFIVRHGKGEAERRLAEGFSAVLECDLTATIDDAGTVHIGEPADG